MQRKSTKTTRGPNASEQRFQGWLKERNCVWCGNPGPSIVDHCRGATFKHNKTLIGHTFCVPQCVTCDTQKTIHGKRLGNESEACLRMIMEYTLTRPEELDDSVILAIEDWGR